MCNKGCHAWQRGSWTPMAAMDDDYPILGQLIIVNLVEDESSSLIVPTSSFKHRIYATSR